MTDLLMWPVAAVSLAATVANVHKRRWCFAAWTVTNALWCIYDLSIGAYSQALLFAVYAGLSIYGWCKWSDRG